MLSLVITTNERPETLSRALSSCAACPSLCGGEVPLTVLDDSRESGYRAANADVISAEARVLGVPVRHLSREDRDAFIRNAGSAGPALAEVLEFALDGSRDARLAGRAGHIRNASLLMSPGRKVVSADDDTLFRFRRFRENASVSTGDGGADGLPHFLPMAPGGTDRITEEYPGDPLRDFGGVLGTPVRAFSPGAPFSGKVRAAMAGVRGGRWYSSPFAVMDVDPALHRLAWKDSGEYAAAKRDPDALLLARAPLLTRNPFFVASFFGWDGSEILPPFFPNIRNSDGIWSFLCRTLYPDSPVCHMPFAVEHDRSVHPPFSDADFADFSPPAAGIIMMICGFFFRDIEMGNPEAALMALGSRLSGCAAFPKREWRRFVTELHLAGEGSKIRRLEARLDAAGGEPGYWAADAARHISSLKKAALSCEPYLTREFFSFGRDAEEAFRDYLARCGELLAAWPEIWERMR